MSKYSGHDDVYDRYGGYTDEELKEVTFWVGEHPTPLKIESQKDLAPYYPNRIIGENERGIYDEAVVYECRFSDEPAYLITSEITELFNLLKEYRRKHKSFKSDLALKYCKDVMIYISLDKDIQMNVVNEVRRKGENASIKSIKSIEKEIYNPYRQMLCDEMIRLGWLEGEACYWTKLFDRLHEYHEKQANKTTDI